MKEKTGSKYSTPPDAFSSFSFIAALVVLALTLPEFSCIELLSYHVRCRLKPDSVIIPLTKKLCVCWFTSVMSNTLVWICTIQYIFVCRESG